MTYQGQNSVGKPADGVCLLALGTLGTTALKRAKAKGFGTLFYPI